jgi:hypothetical protein
MSELSFAKFGPDSAPELATKDVIEKHNSHISSFFKDDLETIRDDEAGSATYESLLSKLSKVIRSIGGDTYGDGEDLSNIKGDTMSQVYYYSITAIMLYLLYRILYAKNK